MPRKQYPKFSGPLAEPIYEQVGAGLLGIPTPSETAERVLDRQCEKLLLLLDHYKIDRAHVSRWFLLSLGLALDFVPGMEAATSPRGKPGRKRTWKVGLGEELV